jgi:hypothetical protein
VLSYFGSFSRHGRFTSSAHSANKALLYVEYAPVWAAARYNNQLINTAITQSLNQSLSQSINQSINQYCLYIYIYIYIYISVCSSCGYRRPNGWADPANIWQKYSLGQCDGDRGVGDRECAFMRALRAQMCAQHHISSIGGQTVGPVEPQIGTHTLWDNGQKLWESAIASAH